MKLFLKQSRKAMPVVLMLMLTLTFVPTVPVYGVLHGDGPFLLGSWGFFFHAHDTPRGWVIIISQTINGPSYSPTFLGA